MSHLLRTRRFLPLFITQFLGAFNDNVFKNALVIRIAYHGVHDNAPLLITLAAALFILPYLLFSATAGQLADKYDRGLLAQRTKVAEILIMGISAIGFYADATYFLLFALFSLGIQATFFGPVKYALLPQHLRDDELVEGNAWIEAGTFLAILLGTIIGGVLAMQPDAATPLSLAMILCALMGYISSRYIPRAGSPDPALKIQWNIAAQTWRMIGHDRKNRKVFRAILGISWFWLVGATFLSQFPAYAKEVLHAGETVVTLFLFVFSLGIGCGSMLCSFLLKGQVKATYVPLAAMCITLFTVDLYAATTVSPAVGALLDIHAFLAQWAQWRILFDLYAVAVCGGMYAVPLYAIMQHDSDPAFRARTIATNNVLNAVFMVVAALGAMAMLAASYSVPQLYLTIALLNAPVALYALRVFRL